MRVAIAILKVNMFIIGTIVSMNMKRKNAEDVKKRKRKNAEDVMKKIAGGNI